jgi:hypothetical protein
MGLQSMRRRAEEIYAELIFTKERQRHVVLLTFDPGAKEREPDASHHQRDEQPEDRID